MSNTLEVTWSEDWEVTQLPDTTNDTPIPSSLLSVVQYEEKQTEECDGAAMKETKSTKTAGSIDNLWFFMPQSQKSSPFLFNLHIAITSSTTTILYMLSSAKFIEVYSFVKGNSPNDSDLQLSYLETNRGHFTAYPGWQHLYLHEIFLPAMLQAQGIQLKFVSLLSVSESLLVLPKTFAQYEPELAAHVQDYHFIHLAKLEVIQNPVDFTTHKINASNTAVVDNHNSNHNGNSSEMMTEMMMRMLLPPPAHPSNQTNTVNSVSSNNSNGSSNSLMSMMALLAASSSSSSSVPIKSLPALIATNTNSSSGSTHSTNSTTGNINNGETSKSSSSTSAANNSSSTNHTGSHTSNTSSGTTMVSPAINQTALLSSLQTMQDQLLQQLSLQIQQACQPLHQRLATLEDKLDTVIALTNKNTNNKNSNSVTHEKPNRNNVDNNHSNSNNYNDHDAHYGNTSNGKNNGHHNESIGIANYCASNMKEMSNIRHLESQVQTLRTEMQTVLHTLASCAPAGFVTNTITTNNDSSSNHFNDNNESIDDQKCR